MSLNRRGFFGTIAAAFVARALPVQPTRISTAAVEHAMHSQEMFVGTDGASFYILSGSTWRADWNGVTQIVSNRDAKAT